MALFSFIKKNKTKKRRLAYCEQAKVFIQVHFVNERNNTGHAFNTLSLKSDPMRDECNEWYAAHNNPTTFSEIVTAYIKDSNFNTQAFCQKASFEPQYFEKLEKAPNYHPAKGEAVALCLGLKLNLEHARALLTACDYTLTSSSYSDLIIRFFLENELYGINDLNFVLSNLADVKLKDI